MKKIRTAGAALAPVVLGAAAALAVAGTASAAPVQAAAAASEGVGPSVSPTYCGGDVCAHVYLPVNAPDFSEIVVQVWAYKSTFAGHFELQVPGVRAPYNSPDAVNRAGVTGYLFEVPNNDGRFTVSGWRETGSSWAGNGSLGFSGAVI
jgi:hypothetical protein